MTKSSLFCNKTKLNHIQEQLKEYLTEYHYTSEIDIKIAGAAVPSSRYTILSHQTFETT